MSEDIIVNESVSAFYLKSASAIVTEKKSASSKPVTPTSAAINKNTENTDDGLIAKWGDDNLFPQTVLEECESSTIIPSTLDWKSRALYSGGIVVGKSEFIEKGGEVVEIFKPEKNTDWEKFYKTNNIKKYLIEAASDFYWFYNVFPEIILSRDRSKITNIAIQEAYDCRWSFQNEKTGLVDFCYIDKNWKENGGRLSSKFVKVPVIDPYYDPVTALRERKDSFKYIYPVSYPTPGKTFYQLAHWNSIRKSGWLDIATEIAKFKKSLMENQLSIKYHIQIADYWWTWKYPKWASYDDKKRSELKTTELTAFNEFLKGSEKAGKSIITTFKFDPHINREYPGWKIEALDDKIKEGAYIEDSQEASSHMLYALGVDGTLIGTAPGKNIGAGSGSDKRVAFNIYISLCKIHQDIILEPFEFIRDYNGWDPDLQFRFRNSLITTLDKGKETQQQSS